MNSDLFEEGRREEIEEEIMEISDKYSDCIESLTIKWKERK